MRSARDVFADYVKRAAEVVGRSRRTLGVYGLVMFTSADGTISPQLPPLLRLKAVMRSLLGMWCTHVPCGFECTLNLACLMQGLTGRRQTVRTPLQCTLHPKSCI
jgi:hypothetical protein